MGAISRVEMFSNEITRGEEVVKSWERILNRFCSSLKRQFFFTFSLYNLENFLYFYYRF